MSEPNVTDYYNALPAIEAYEEEIARRVAELREKHAHDPEFLATVLAQVQALGWLSMADVAMILIGAEGGEIDRAQAVAARARIRRTIEPWYERALTDEAEKAIASQHQ